MNGVKLVERDRLILSEVDRWRVITGKQICGMTGFSGVRACDRRLHKLICAGLLERKKFLYGIPSLYMLTPFGREYIGAPDRSEHIRVEQIVHDIAVADTAIYFNRKYGVAFSDISTEKQLHRKDGFGVRVHRPDFVFTQNGKRFCVEIELAMKSKERFAKNIVSDFTDYEGQFWIVPDLRCKIATFLLNMNKSYPNIKLIELSEVKNFEYCQTV